MKNKYILGIDIGGTKVEAALFNSKLKLVRGDKIPTPLDPQDFLTALKTLVNELLGKDKLSAIGVGAPGELDLDHGNVLRAINTPALENMNIVKKLEDMFDVPVYLENDGHAIALGEALYGAGKEYNSVFAITLGTGVGGGFVLKRDRTSVKRGKTLNLQKGFTSAEIFRGSTFSATEVGHMIIATEGATCTCGNRGCLEEYVSTRAIRRLSTMTPLEMQRKAKEENPRAKFTWSRIGFYLGIGLANIVNMFNPEIILIGGGIAKASKYYIEYAEKIMHDYAVSPLAKKKTKLAIIKTPYAGARGAAALTQNKQ